MTLDEKQRKRRKKETAEKESLKGPGECEGAWM